MADIKVNLGDKVRDRVSGVTGIATAQVRYLNGCVQFGVNAQVGADGKVPEAVFIDHAQLEVVEAGAVEVEAGDTGGPSHYGL